MRIFYTQRHVRGRRPHIWDRSTFVARPLSLAFNIFIYSSSLSYDRPKASSKASSPHSAIQSFLLQMRVSSPFLKVIQ